jgi:hypothetical protein
MDRRTWIVLGVLAFVLTRAARAASVNFKPGVDLSLRPEMAKALPLIEQAHDDVGIARGAYITSGKDGVHGPDSLHALGLAVDLRTRDLPSTTVTALVSALQSRLNGSASATRPYQMVVEPNASAPTADPHIHIEYQPYPGYRG